MMNIDTAGTDSATGRGGNSKKSPQRPSVRALFFGIVIFATVVFFLTNSAHLTHIHGNDVEGKIKGHMKHPVENHHAHPMLSHLMEEFVIQRGDEWTEEKQTEEEKADGLQWDDKEEEVEDLFNKKSGKNEKGAKEAAGAGKDETHNIAGLNCAPFGGPSSPAAIDDMVYWNDIPSDSRRRSPFYDEEKFLTFEPDKGGWNNIRMAMETVLVMAHGMGRTLVLPPEAPMYLLRKKSSDGQKKEFGFNDFFHMDSIGEEHDGLNIISMKEFLTRESLTGRLLDVGSGKPIYPPGGRVKWDGDEPKELWKYLRQVGQRDVWNGDCIAAIPASKDPADVETLQKTFDNIMKNHEKEDPMDFNGKPTQVDASVEDRLREIRAKRKKICIYDGEMQGHRLVHFKVDHSEKARLLIHFYAFVFFQDWTSDLWSKRFVRDHIRYRDELMCAAGRIVEAIRSRSRALNGSDSDGAFDAVHIRRGDFQYKSTRLNADELVKRSVAHLNPNGILYIATDEGDKKFFAPFKEKYPQILFLDDFKKLIPDLNTNYYGMLDQVVCYRAKAFYGTFFSSFTGYINRMRGYFNAKHKLGKYKEGVLDSWYFFPDDRVEQMRMYQSVRPPYYMREFPVGWRDLDKDLD
mmetsp:Transcript_49195/g.96191  ORF Transcript_49195/g.96191 Transcript_49195/m.96191 type:complete len:632 (+) Transcript_49195:77-1972(+)